MNEDNSSTENTQTFNVPMNFIGKLVVTTRTTEKITYEENDNGSKSSSLMETETVTTYEHIQGE